MHNHKTMICYIVYILLSVRQLLKYYQTETKTFRRRQLVVQLDSVHTAKNVIVSPENLQVLVQF